MCKVGFELNARTLAASPALIPENWISASVDIRGLNSDDGDDNESQRLLNTPEELPQRKRPSSSDIPLLINATKSRRTSIHQSAANLAKEGMQDLGDCIKAAMVRGITNTCADPLSRYPHANSHVQEELNALSTSDIHPTVIQRIKNAYVDDTFFGPVITMSTFIEPYQKRRGLE